MNVIRGRNVHRILPVAVDILHEAGVKRDSRNGSVYVVDGPVTTMYERPEERVVFWAERDANPFLHFYESLWMLGGRNDVRSLTRFTKNMGHFSDNGEVFNAAYGYRWRVARYFNENIGIDQLRIIAQILQEDKNSRQCVLQIWDHALDLGTN